MSGNPCLLHKSPDSLNLCAGLNSDALFSLIWLFSFVPPPLARVGGEVCIGNFWNSVPGYFVWLKAFSAARIINFSFWNCKVRGCKRTLSHHLYASSVFLVLWGLNNVSSQFPLLLYPSRAFPFPSLQILTFPRTAQVSGCCPTIFQELVQTIDNSAFFSSSPQSGSKSCSSFRAGLFKPTLTNPCVSILPRQPFRLQDLWGAFPFQCNFALFENKTKLSPLFKLLWITDVYRKVLQMSWFSQIF